VIRSPTPFWLPGPASALGGGSFQPKLDCGWDYGLIDAFGENQWRSAWNARLWRTPAPPSAPSSQWATYFFGIMLRYWFGPSFRLEYD